MRVSRRTNQNVEWSVYLMRRMPQSSAEAVAVVRLNLLDEWLFLWHHVSGRDLAFQERFRGDRERFAKFEPQTSQEEDMDRCAIAEDHRHGPSRVDTAARRPDPHRLKALADDFEHAQTASTDPERKQAFGKRLTMIVQMLAAVPSAKPDSESAEHKFSTWLQFDPKVTALIKGMARKIPDEDDLAEDEVDFDDMLLNAEFAIPWNASQHSSAAEE
jgi:hypothetical protein